MKFKLVNPNVERRANDLLARANHEDVVEVSDWEVLESVAEKLKKNGNNDVVFFRDDPGRRVTYSLDEILIAVENKIECRPFD